MSDQLGRLLDPTQPHHCSSASYCWTPPPRQDYLQHTIGNSSVSWFGAIRPLWRASVPFLNNAKLLILSCWRTVAIDARINQLKHVVMIQKSNMKRLLDLIYTGVWLGPFSSVVIFAVVGGRGDDSSGIPCSCCTRVSCP
jgi:hypothetical protein